MAEVVIDVVARDSFSGTLGNFGSIMTGIESAINLAGRAFQTFTGFAMQGLDAIASYERMAASLETLVAKELLATGQAADMAAALKLSGDQAEDLLKWTQELAISSPFSAEGVNAAFRMAMAYGFTTEEAKRLTEAMIDFAAGSGASEASMEAIARALGQISATGKVTGGDMLQLVNAGLPVVEILAEGFGVTTAQLMDMRSKGLLPATEAIEYITQYLEKNFAGAAERQATTWAGLQGTFKDIKDMGLREFFGGLFDVLQPLAVELSEFLQTEGMDKLREWGSYLGIFTQAVTDLVLGNKLYDLGAALQELGGKDSFFYALGTAIRTFQQAIDDGATNRDAFLEALSKFTDLSGIEISSDALAAFIDRLDARMALAINQAVVEGKFANAGDAFGNMIVSLFTTGLDSAESRTGSALGDAIAQFFRGAVGDVWFEHSAQDITSALLSMLVDGVQNALTDAAITAHEMWINFWINLFRSDDLEPFDYTFEMGKDMMRGLWAGLNSFDVSATNWVRDHIVTPIKQFLGISSPSTVFMEIGRNIVQGLIDGVGAMWSSFTSFISSKLGALLSNLSWENILALLTGDMSLSDMFSGGGTSLSTGSIPGSSFYIPTGTTSGSGGSVLTGGNCVTNNFYAPVYVGSMQELQDCPSPHPLMVASSQSLVTSTVTP